MEQKAIYHESCYSNFVRTNKLQRAKKRYNDSVTSGESWVIKRKQGRPSINTKSDISENLTTRSKTTPYDRKLCIICRVEGGKLHRVETKETGNSMLNVAQNLPDKAFFRRLNNICIAEDAIANEVMYHNLCWVRSKNKTTRMKVKPKEDVARALADIDLINYIVTNLVQPNKVLDVNMLNSTYRDILIENGVNKDKISSNYKKYIKELIQDNITKVVFIPSKQKNTPERIMTNLTQAEALNTYIDNEAEEQDFKALWRLSKKIRNDVLS